MAHYDAKVTQKLKQDFALWAWSLGLEGASLEDIETLRAQIREELKTPDGLEYWTMRLEEEAALAMELRKMAAEAIQRIKHDSASRREAKNRA